MLAPSQFQTIIKLVYPVTSKLADPTPVATAF